MFVPRPPPRRVPRRCLPLRVSPHARPTSILAPCPAAASADPLLARDGRRHSRQAGGDGGDREGRTSRGSTTSRRLGGDPPRHGPAHERAPRPPPVPRGRDALAATHHPPRLYPRD